jgi:carbon-monoxide dehydrogenase small subunit
MKRQVTLNVNGDEHEVEIEPNRLLLQVFRDTIGLTGTKEGCSIGVCGACSVIIDGRLVSSCLTLAAACGGKKIETIEGLVKNGKLHPLQQAFIEFGGFQCASAHPARSWRLKRCSMKTPSQPKTKSKTGCRAIFAAAPVITKSLNRSWLALTIRSIQISNSANATIRPRCWQVQWRNGARARTLRLLHGKGQDYDGLSLR